MTETTEAEIRAMGAVAAIERGLLHVIGKDTDTPPANNYLLILTSAPTRGCTFNVSSGEMSVFIELQIFYQFDVWYDAEAID